MARRGSSGRWLERQRRDHYVRQSRDEGYRSRAAYKLLELDRRDRLLARGARVVDLGAAPGRVVGAAEGIRVDGEATGHVTPAQAEIVAGARVLTLSQKLRSADGSSAIPVGLFGLQT